MLYGTIYKDCSLILKMLKLIFYNTDMYYALMNLVFDYGIWLVVERSTSVCYAVGAKVMGSIPHVAEIIFSHIYSQKIICTCTIIIGLMYQSIYININKHLFYVHLYL